MKKLIFLENGFEEEAREASDRAKRVLWGLGTGEFSKESLGSMELISDFTRVPKEKKLEIIFNPENIICTWSVYTDDSLVQLFGFLESAGSNRVKNQIYIDTSGALLEALDQNFNCSSEETLNIFNAIETNFICPVWNEENPRVKGLQRVRVDLKGKDKSYFRLESITLNL